MRGSLSPHCAFDKYCICEGATRTTICSLSIAFRAVGCCTRICRPFAAGPLPVTDPDSSKVSFVAQVPQPARPANSGNAIAVVDSHERRCTRSDTAICAPLMSLLTPRPAVILLYSISAEDQPLRIAVEVTDGITKALHGG